MLNQEVKLLPSRFYSIFLGATLLASMVIVSLLPLAIGLKILLILVGGIYGVVIVWRYALLRAASSITGMAKLEGEKWRIITPSGSVEAVLRGDSTVTAIVSVLRFDFPGRRQPVSCMVFKDSLAADEYRQLVGMIRMGG